MLRFTCLFFLLTLPLLYGFSQESESQVLQEKIDQLSEEYSYKAKQNLNQELKGLLSQLCELDPNFNKPFFKVKGISILYPTDSSFRLINWNLAYSDGTHSYECGVQRKGLNEIIFLKQRESAVPTNFLFTDVDTNNQYSNVTATKEDWIGALYYDVIQTKGRFNTFYTLLGWDGNDLLTNKKVVDVLWFNKAHEIKFGAPIFKSNTSIKSRIIFEFGGQNTMRLYKHNNFNRIIFDHLSAPPANIRETTELDGIYDYYGADLSYDALDWENGYWVLKSNIDPEETDEKNLDDNPSLKQAPSAKDFIQKENAEKVKQEKPIYKISKPQ